MLLDTHVVLWWLADDPTVSEEIKVRLDHDPFDRMLVAQAQCENLTLVTGDAEIHKYEASVPTA